MSGACARELPPLEVAAARGCHRCLGLLLRGQEPLVLQRSRSPAQEPGWPSRALSFLTEDGSDDSDARVTLGNIPEAGPLSSTHRSLLGDSGVPWLWPECPQKPCGDTAVPVPPLASSTLLWDCHQPQEPPPSRVLRTRTQRRNPGLGDIAVPCPRCAGAVSPRQHQGGTLGTRTVSPRSPQLRDGSGSRPVSPQSSGDTAGDTPWGRPAGPDMVVTQPGAGDPAGLGDSNSLGDSTESFVTADESLGGAPGGAAPAPTPRDLGLGLGENLGLEQALGLEQGLGWDLRQGLGLGQGLGQKGSGAAPQTPAFPRDLGALLAQLGGCHLGVSPPCSTRGPCSPGGVTSRGCDDLGDHHVTPRSRSRLRALAARLRSCSSSSSSSSSLLPETLRMSPRVPKVAVTSPPGRCVTAGDRDVSAAHGEGTGGSWGDTRIVPGLSPRGGSIPRSGPGVLRGLRDKRHPQNCSESPPRVQRHPRKSPCVTRGVPSATRKPEGGSGWQRPLPLGTPSVPLSPSEELGTSSVPLSPGCATRRSERHQEDVTPRECRSPRDDTGATSSPRGGTRRDGHVSPGDNPSPVTAWGQWGWPQGHSPELVATLRTGLVPDCAQDELALSGHFERLERSRPWPGGHLKSSFNYLLLDPRVTRDLPRRSPSLSPAELFRTFVTAVFYVGKGTRARPWWHLHQALAQHRRGTQRGGPKVRRILSIWAAGLGVVPLQCFQHRPPAEALTRESCMLEALGLQTVTNQRRGPCYGPAAAWGGPRRRRLGVSLLHRAMGVLLAEGERQIHPGDIPGPP